LPKGLSHGANPLPGGSNAVIRPRELKQQWQLLVGDHWNPVDPDRRLVRAVRRSDRLSQLVIEGCREGLHGDGHTVGVGAEPSPAIVGSASTGQEPNRLSPEGVMDNLQIRPHARNPNLWWVSSQGDDVAYITRPGNAYLAWATDKWKPSHADFVGKRFDTVDEALQAVARSFS
jgi:hypothetical protein